MLQRRIRPENQVAPSLSARAECKNQGPGRGGTQPRRVSRATFHFHSFQGSFFSGNHQEGKPLVLKRTMVEKNGESTPRVSVKMGVFFDLEPVSWILQGNQGNKIHFVGTKKSDAHMGKKTCEKHFSWID